MHQRQRQTEVKIGNQWTPFEFAQLKPGDIFRLIENGKVYVNSKGQSRWKASSVPFTNADGVLTINVYNTEEYGA